MSDQPKVYRCTNPMCRQKFDTHRKRQVHLNGSEICRIQTISGRNVGSNVNQRARVFDSNTSPTPSLPTAEAAPVQKKGALDFPEEWMCQFMGDMDLNDEDPFGKADLLQKVVLEKTVETTKEHSDGEEDEVDPAFPVDMSFEEEESSQDEFVEVGDQLKSELPQEILDAMFQPPEGFGPDYLHNKIGKDGGVKYGNLQWNHLTPEQKSNIDLLKILKGQPMYLFDEIQKWRHRSHVCYGDNIRFDRVPKSREASLSELKATYGYDCLDHKQIPLTLPATGKKVKLTVFPFGNMLSSLLTGWPEFRAGSGLWVSVCREFCAGRDGGRARN
ncbi:MAG: hypothetical protein AAF587_44575 [Bacteroidota bacterium]